MRRAVDLEQYVHGAGLLRPWQDALLDPACYGVKTMQECGMAKAATTARIKSRGAACLHNIRLLVRL